VGLGILYANNARITSFTSDHNKDATELVKSEITRTEKSMWE